MATWSPLATVYNPLICGSIDGTDEFPHDRGIARALTARYKPNKQVLGDPLCTIFVGRLNPDTGEDTLIKVFSEYGSIKRLRLVKDIISGESKRYAFVEYKSGSSAKMAVHRADKLIIDERQILVDMEVERELSGWVPRRLGGGFGGKKESGQLRFGGKDRPFKKPIVLHRFHSSNDGPMTPRAEHKQTVSESNRKQMTARSPSRSRDRSRSRSRTRSRVSYKTTTCLIDERGYQRRRSRSRSPAYTHSRELRRSRDRSRERGDRSKEYSNFGRDRSNHSKDHKGCRAIDRRDTSKDH